MITLKRIKDIADDIIADTEWVDTHTEAEQYNGIVDGLNRLIKHLEETEETK